jgi:hypothetical protein
MKYYIVINGEQKGPFSIDELRSQGITPETLVWKEGYAGWVKAGSVPELSGIFTTPPPHDGTGAYQAYQSTSGMGQNANGYSQPYSTGGQPMGEMPKTWLVESIIATVLCCLPLGIAALVNAADVESTYRVGRYNDAVRKSQNAKNWLIWSVVAHVMCWVLVIGFILMFGLAASAHL